MNSLEGLVMPVDPKRVQSVFLAAVEHGSPEDRAAVLDRECGPDPESDLRRRVEALLRAHDDPDSHLDRPIVDPGGTATTTLEPGEGAGPATAAGRDAAVLDEPTDPCGEREAIWDRIDGRAPGRPTAEGLGARLGPYTPVRSIGEGGMGTVYLAEQTEPVRRTVALKLIKAGMDSRQVLARFEAERQALALMDHPHIARVLDAGTSGAGRPYFVMELVEGVPITRYCDERRLTLRERLELAIPVCQAVQHAHQKGIIHRDLKPSNILIALYDGRPVPKVIDFGVAKATGQRLIDETLHTEFGAVIGTLEYMSPEQAELNALDVDTRSDIYSLGVLLYELLTGTTPLERRRARSAAFHEVLREIREEESPRPSLRLSTTEGLPSIAACRNVEPRRISGLVRGELDWIVMKALEKDRDRRYETAIELASDLRRYLDDESVHAGPPSGWYRLSKSVRRNKSRLAMAGLIVLCLVLIGGGGGWIAGDRAARRARAAEGFDEALREAGASLREDNEPAARAAAQRAAGLLAGVGGDAVLQRRLKRVEGDLEMVAKLDWARLQRTELNHGHFDSARADPAYAEAFRAYDLPVLELQPDEAARRISRSTIREQLLAALVDWANIDASRPDYNKLNALIRLADRDPWRQRRFDALDRHDHPELVRLAREPEALSQPAARLAAFGNILARFDLPAAVEFLRRAQRRHPDDFWINHQLAVFLKNSKPPRLDEAIGFYRAAVAVRRESPGAHLNLGSALSAQGRPAEAEAEYREAIRLKPDYSEAHASLGGILNDHKGDHDGAIAAFTEAIRSRPDNAMVHRMMGMALLKKGKLDEALAACEEAVRLQPDQAMAHYSLGIVLARKGRPDQAITAYQEALRLDPQEARYHGALGIALAGEDRLDEAIVEFQQALCLQPDDPEAHCNLGSAVASKGRDDEAIRAFKEAIRLKPDLAQAHVNLGKALSKSGRFRQAVEEFRLGHQFGSRMARWPYPSERWLRDAERMADLDARLPRILEGKDQPADAGDRLALAHLFQKHRARYAAATRWFEQAFAARPVLAEDPRSGNRYNAACAAALAGSGQGKDAPAAGDPDRARLRQRAVQWLRADLAAWSRQLEGNRAKSGPIVRQKMEHWLADPDFAGVRRGDALAKLPEAERQQWQELWADVENALAEATQPPRDEKAVK